MPLQEIGQELARPVGVPESELPDFGGRDPAAIQIGASLGPGRARKAGAESLFGEFVHLENSGSQPGIGVGKSGALGQWNAAALGKLFQRFVEADALDLLDEFEDIAALTAAEAFIKLMVGMDPKGGRLFGMEGAPAR